jgi:hypothetical protein
MALEISAYATSSRGGTMSATRIRKNAKELLSCNVKDKSSSLNNVVDIRLIKLIELAKQLESDCYNGRPIEESKNDFLTKISLLRDKGSKCY